MSEAPVSQAFLDHSVRLAQIANPQSEIAHFDDPLPLDCGEKLAPFSIAYQTYGTLNADKSNLVLVCHALTGDQHVANVHPVTGKPGWWETMVGPGKPIDTNRYFVLCPNVIGGCMGSTGPSSINPATGRPYGLDFPVITIADMVRAQARLLDHLGIPVVLCVLGGSMGGMQVLEWAATYKDRVFSAVPIACAARHSSQNIAFHEVGRQAVMADPDWCQGRYLDRGQEPAQRPRRCAHGGAHHLSVGRRAAHEVRPQPAGSRQDHLRLRRRLPGGELSPPSGLELRRPLRRQLLSLHHPRHGLFRSRRGPWRRARQRLSAARTTRFCLVSFTSDWLFPTEESREIVHALNAVAANVSFVELKTERRPRLLPAARAGAVRHHPRIRECGGAPARHRRAGGLAAVNVNVPPHGLRTANDTSRVDLLLIAEMVTPGARVLDIGCGDGTLMRLLAAKRGADARGIELSPGRGELLRGARACR